MRFYFNKLQFIENQLIERKRIRIFRISFLINFVM